MLETEPEIQPKEDVDASKNSSIFVTRLSLWGCSLVGIGLFAFTSKHGLSSYVPVFVLGFVALMDWCLRRQMRSGEVLVPLDADGIRPEDQAAPPLNNQRQEEAEFQQRLKAFAPTPWVTYGLIAVNVVVWLATLMHGGGIGNSPTDLLLRWGGNAASEVQRGEWWRMVSALFLHNGLMHVAFNMLGLLSVGITVERIYGHRLYALIYFGSGLVGSALSLHFSAQRLVAVGASGAVFGIAGAMLIAFVQHRKELPTRMGKRTLSGLGIYFLYSLADGAIRPGIDNGAHVGGLLAGCLLTYVLPQRFDMENYVRQYKKRAVAALVLAIGAVVILACTAPVAKVDQRGGQYFLDGSRKLLEVGKAMEKEAQSVKEGKLSAIQSDERSRTVLAPMMRDVVATLNRATLAEGDPRAPMLAELQRYSALVLESLEMESIVPRGSNKPEPVNPKRMAEIEKEVLAIAKRIEVLRGELAKKKGQ